MSLQHFTLLFLFQIQVIESEERQETASLRTGSPVKFSIKAEIAEIALAREPVRRLETA